MRLGQQGAGWVEAQRDQVLVAPLGSQPHLPHLPPNPLLQQLPDSPSPNPGLPVLHQLRHLRHLPPLQGILPCYPTPTHIPLHLITLPQLPKQGVDSPKLLRDLLHKLSTAQRCSSMPMPCTSSSTSNMQCFISIILP